jgi:peptidoglycan pentaglycine glycine transferase (the first glycine)
MPIISLTNWNHFLPKNSNTHLLQTGEWGELKSAFGWKPVRVVNGDFGAQILFRKLPLGFTIGYIPKSNPDKSLLPEIDAVCKSQRAVFLKVEPDSWDSEFTIHHSAFIISKHNIQPPRTIIIDLRGTEDEILAKMKQKTRYNIRLAEKKGVIVRAWDDIESFHKMMLVTGGREESIHWSITNGHMNFFGQTDLAKSLSLNTKASPSPHCL